MAGTSYYRMLNSFYRLCSNDKSSLGGEGGVSMSMPSTMSYSSRHSAVKACEFFDNFYSLLTLLFYHVGASTLQDSWDDDDIDDEFTTQLRAELAKSG